MNCVEDDMNERSKHGLPIGLFKVICAVSVFAMIAVVGCGTVCETDTEIDGEDGAPGGRNGDTYRIRSDVQRW